MKEENQIWFEKKLKGTLSAEEELEFDGKLKSDPAFASSFELFQEMDQFLEEKNTHGTALDVLREVAAEQKGQDTSKVIQHPAGKVAPFNRRIFLRVALLLFSLTFAIGYFSGLFQKGAIVQLASYEEVQEDPTWDDKRGEGDRLDEIIVDYRNGNTDQAISDLENIEGIKPEVKNYWLAELYLLEREPDKVLHHLDLISFNEEKKDRIKFVEALAYLLKEDAGSILNIIESLPEDFDPYYEKRIRKMVY